MIKLFQKLERVSLIDRLNRFTLLVSNDKGDIMKAYLPNSGSLEELLIPGRVILVTQNPGGGLPLRVAGTIDEDGNAIMIDSLKINEIFPAIINNIPSLKGYSISQREVRYKNARFDFLLEKEGEKLILEIKGCTLFTQDVASFPDAPTKRGVKHLKLLSDLQSDLKGGILFLIQKPVKYFLPNFHTDLEFAREIFKAKDKILIEAISLKWDEELNLIEDSISKVEIPWEATKPFLEDKGVYLILMFNEKDKQISFSRGLREKSALFPRGFYIYTGSALKGLSSRIKRHIKKEGKNFWHIDYIKRHMKTLKAITIKSPNKIECEIANELMTIADSYILNFGSSDCNCKSHLLYFQKDPRKMDKFIKTILKFRFDIIKDIVERTSQW
ncbi:MAG: DNA/RNA nuclease SfsA [Synergistetes bacterium]|nr:DNA/RNA nuclease SfsA [Synergistota bacterium]MDW8192385.1 DNA/RNA nuclease SfsA [Synergistota bacterium]